MKRILLLILSLLVACTAPSARRTPANYDETLTYTIANSERLDFTTFLKLIRDQHADTIAKAVEVVSSNYNEYLKSRATVFESNSLQDASFTEPRVIVFGPDAKFVFAFNGHGPTIEAFQFDEQKSFNFREIVFKKEAKGFRGNFSRSETEFETPELIVSKSNPFRCMECHGFNQTGPIWSNSFMWPGVYGSNDDLLFSSFYRRGYTNHGAYEYLKNLKYPRSQGRWIDLPTQVRDVELDGYQDYLQGANTHPRYKSLPAQIFDAGFIKLNQGIAAEQIDESDRFEAEVVRVMDQNVYRPNLRFTHALLKLTSESLFAKVALTPGLSEQLHNLIAYRFDGPESYAYFFGFTRQTLLADWGAQLSRKMSPEMLASLSHTAGSFSSYVNQVIQEEMQMQDQIVRNQEKTFRAQLFVSPQWPQFDAQAIEQTVKAYEPFLGHKLSRTEVIAIGSEALSLPNYALIGYVLKSRGIDLRDYDINSLLYDRRERKRVVSFESSRILRKILNMDDIDQRKFIDQK
jgi:hypothetical protein